MAKIFANMTKEEIDEACKEYFQSNPYETYEKEVKQMIDGKIKVYLDGLTNDQLSELSKLTAKQIYTQGYVAGEMASQVETWNDAIEAAINRINTIAGNDSYIKAWKIAMAKLEELKKCGCYGPAHAIGCKYYMELKK